MTPIIYVLPKIHKDPINPPDRPIVSSTASVTMPLAKYLDRCLTPLIIQIRSYIRDTQDFLSKIQPLIIPPDALLVTWDVANLYTAIPHNLFN